MHKLALKTPAQITIMAEGGHKLAQVRQKLVAAVKPGITTAQLDQLADKLIKAFGGQPSFKMVPGYRWATCINVNDIVVHGLPNRYRLKTGDIVGIDVGMYYQGFHTDTSISVGVGHISSSAQKFLDIGRLALKKAVSRARPGKRVQDISTAMQQTVESAGYSVVRALTGHGIGQHLHEEPAIPCFVMGSIAHAPKLVPGMTLAIEVMYNQGSSEVVYQNDDGWTIATADGKISGLFEETVAVTSGEPQVLTAAK